jgi:Icc-related predicted phosphoesterase
MKKFRITAISDTHTLHNGVSLPGGDILIHSGDFTSIGSRSEVEDFIDWFTKQPYTHKIFIAGNHDISFDSERKYKTKYRWAYDSIPYDTGSDCVIQSKHDKPDWLKERLNNLSKGVYYLENSSVTVEGINIWGSPYSPTFGHGWGFNADRGYDINQYWATIPMDTDIVITHTPIYGYNDRTLNTNQNVGCADLYHRLHEVKPHLHFCGHIHEGFGWKQIEYKRDWGCINTINASTLNLWYEVHNPPVIIDYDFLTREIEFI